MNKGEELFDKVKYGYPDKSSIEDIVLQYSQVDIKFATFAFLLKNKLSAIRFYYHTHNITLREAKEYIDKFSIDEALKWMNSYNLLHPN